MSRETILQEINDKLDYQDKKWSDEDLNYNMPNDFVSYISYYSTQWLSGYVHPYRIEEIYKFRESMLKVAALGINAAEYAERLINKEVVRPEVMVDE